MLQILPTGIDPGTVRLVAQHLNHYATPGPSGFQRTKIKHRTKSCSSYCVQCTNLLFVEECQLCYMQEILSQWARNMSVLVYCHIFVI